MIYTAFTDGSCTPNPGLKCGYSFIITSKEKILYSFVNFKIYKYKKATSILAELTALYKCLMYIKKYKYLPIQIYTDSNYLTQIYNYRAKIKAHSTIWNKIDKYRNDKIEVIWIKGHTSSNKGNCIADRIIYLSKLILENIIN